MNRHMSLVLMMLAAGAIAGPMGGCRPRGGSRRGGKCRLAPLDNRIGVHRSVKRRKRKKGKR